MNLITRYRIWRIKRRLAKLFKDKANIEIDHTRQNVHIIVNNSTYAKMKENMKDV